ncbi:MAG: hypothetical protein ACI36V_06385 [Coriobacteriales bacterium]
MISSFGQLQAIAFFGVRSAMLVASVAVLVASVLERSAIASKQAQGRDPIFSNIGT